MPLYTSIHISHAVLTLLRFIIKIFCSCFCITDIMWHYTDSAAPSMLFNINACIVVCSPYHCRALPLLVINRSRFCKWLQCPGFPNCFSQKYCRTNVPVLAFQNIITTKNQASWDSKFLTHYLNSLHPHKFRQV